MVEPDEMPCDVCGDAVPQCPIEDCHECWAGAHDNGTCNCCYGVICPKHTAAVTHPHAPADHAAPPAGPAGREDE